MGLFLAVSRRGEIYAGFVFRLFKVLIGRYLQNYFISATDRITFFEMHPADMSGHSHNVHHRILKTIRDMQSVKLQKSCAILWTTPNNFT